MNRDPAKTVQRIAFDVLLVAMFASAAVGASDFRQVARYFPLTVSIVGCFFALISLGVDVRRLIAGKQVVISAFDTLAMEHPDRELTSDSSDMTMRVSINQSTILTAASNAEKPWQSSLIALGYLGSIIVYILSVSLLGMIIGSFLYVATFISLMTDWARWKAVALALSVATVMYFLEQYIGIRLPPGIFLS